MSHNYSNYSIAVSRAILHSDLSFPECVGSGHLILVRLRHAGVLIGLPEVNIIIMPSEHNQEIVRKSPDPLSLA